MTFTKSEEAIMRAALQRQELLMQRLEIGFERSVQALLNKHAAIAEKHAREENTVYINLVMEGFDEALSKLFASQYIRTGGVFAREFWNSIKSSMERREKKEDEKDLFQILLDEWVKKRTAEKVVNVAETTKKLIASAVRDSISQELGPFGMEQLIRERAGVIVNAKRAKVIARTETHMAAQFANVASAEVSGVPLRKIWLAADDERVREDHTEAAKYSRENTIKAGEPFIVNGDPAMFPGDPSLPAKQSINCRCGVLHRPLELDKKPG